MMATKTTTSRSEELLIIEEADAWYEYREDTLDLHGARYERIEAWAWDKLQVRLRAIATRRSKLHA